MADVKWIKIVTDMFNNRKIKQIRKMPEGDAIIVVWLQLLCLAGQTNDNGSVYFAKDVPFTDEMLATEFDRSINIIRLALSIFEKFGMIEIFDNIYLVSNWEKYQSTDKLEKIREQNRIRKQNQRERDKLKLLECHVTSHANITHSHATDTDIDIDKDINIYSPVIEYLNQKCNTSYRSSSKKTKDLIKARVNDGFTLEDFKKVIDIKSKEWINTDMAKYLRPETLFGTKFEGYLNQSGLVKPKSTNKFHNFIESDVEEGDLEAIARKRFEKIIKDKKKEAN